MRRPLILTGGSWLLAAVAVLWAVVPAGAQAKGPTISLSTTTSKPGAEVIVTLAGWDVGVVTISVCGNDARRGSPDCALRSAQSINTTSKVNPPIAQLIIERPPMPCPCVIRVANTGDDVVQTTPIVLAGVPTAPVIGPDQPGPLMTVHAAITTAKASMIERLRAALGGPSRRTLELVVRNQGTTTGTHVTISAAVGHSRSSGESVTIPAIAAVAPGEARAVSAPVTLGAPTWGHYIVFGTVAGHGVPVAFATSTSSRPFLLFLLATVLLVDLAAMAWIRMTRGGWRLPAHWQGYPRPGRTAHGPPPGPPLTARHVTARHVTARHRALHSRPRRRDRRGAPARWCGRRAGRGVVREPPTSEIRARAVPVAHAARGGPAGVARPELPVSSRETAREHLAGRAITAKGPRSVPAVVANKGPVAATTPRYPRSRFFRSRKALAASLAVALALVVVVVVAARSSSTGGSANNATGGTGAAAAKNQTGGSGGAASAGGQSRAGSTVPAAHGSPTTTPAGGALPAHVDVKGATKAKDGQARRRPRGGRRRFAHVRDRRPLVRGRRRHPFRRRPEPARRRQVHLEAVVAQLR